MIELKELHDATLTEISVNWTTGVLHCSFRVVMGDKQTANITASGLSFVQIPRLFPWGKSESVNSVEFLQQNFRNRLTIEMQSGDVLIADVKSVLVE